MGTYPAWFTGCIIGAVFALVMTPASLDIGFGTFLLNLIAFGAFLAPVVVAVREGSVDEA